MTTTTHPLTSWLLDRIAEDEAVAEAASRYPGGDFAVAALPMPLLKQVARQGPARVLAECAAKRAIVALHVGKQQTSRDFYGEDEWDPSAPMGCSECGTLGEYARRWPCPTLRHLAAVYADAAGYDAAWVVS